MNHLPDTTLAALVDDQRSHPHLDTCPSCHARADALRHLTRNFVAAPANDTDPAAVHAVMNRVDQLSRPSRRPLAWVFAAAAAVAVAVIVVALTGRDDAPRDTFASRGTAHPNGHVLVTPFLHPEPSAPRSPLTPGMTVDRDFALSFRAIAPTSATWLMIAGCDARGDLHWALPVWSDANTNPHGLRLSPDVPLVDLPDALLPDAPPGPFDILVITSSDPVGVQAVEGAVAKTRCDPDSIRNALPNTANVDVVTTRFVVR